MIANGKNILVVGGAGYVGSHTCKALHAAGYLPIAYDNLCAGHASAVKWGPLEVGDLADQARIAEVLDKYRPVAAIHFAAFAAVGESMRDPAKYYANNFAATLVLLDTLRAAGINHLVFSSSCAVYGTPSTVPIVETTPLAPINPYGRSKLMVEQILSDYEHAYGLKWTALRYFNAAGADPDGEIGEDHDPETHLVPRCLMAITGRIDNLEIFGDDFPTDDGTCVRDYIHVCDLATAHIAALERLMEGGASAAINLGAGRGYSVYEVIAAVEKVTGHRVPYTVSSRRLGDPPVLIADPTRARAELNFDPKNSDIEEIVATAWRRMALANR